MFIVAFKATAVQEMGL